MANRFTEWLGFTPRPDYLASPYAEGQLNKIVYADVFGANYAPVTRADAMAIPAFSKARDLLCNAVAQLSLVAVSGIGAASAPLPPANQPRFLYHTDGSISPYLRMLWTADDLLHYGHSLWERRNNATDGRPLDAWRLPIDAWKVDERGRLIRKSDGHIFQESEVIYFPGHTAGVLDRAGSTIRAAINIGTAVEFRSKTPIPVMEIRITEEADIEEDEASDLVKAYNKARLDPDGATIVTPRGVLLVPHGDKADAGFMVEGRNAVRLDMGNITGVPGSLLEGSNATATLTYTTTEGKRSEFHEFAVSPMLNTITGRLSQDDIVPNGTRVEADMSQTVLPVPSAINPTRQD